MDPWIYIFDYETYGRVSFVNCFGLEVTSHQTKIQWGGLGGSIWAKKIMFSLELGCRFSVDLD